MENLEEIKENQDLENQTSVNPGWISPGWGCDLYFPRGLFKINGVWRDRASTLDHLDLESDLLKLEELILCDYSDTPKSDLLLKESNYRELPDDPIIVRLIKYRKSHPASEYRTLNVARNIWPQGRGTTLYAGMYQIFRRYPSMFHRTRLGHFSFKLTNKEMYNVFIHHRRENTKNAKRFKPKNPAKRHTKHEVSIETIRRYARTPNITAKELADGCGIAVPTAAAYIAHANRTVHKHRVVLNVNGSAKELKTLHDELTTQQENGKFQGLKFSLKKV